jgi:Ca2+-binding RTX toxin-like protein
VANGKLSRTARTFRVLNDGNATLSIGKVSVPAGFVVLDGLGSSLAPGQTDNLVIAVDSRTGLGNKSGQVSFATNDSSENPFSFAVSGAVAAGAPGGRPEISVVMTNGQVIADGATSPVSFGSVQRDGRVPTRTFRVRNDGNAALTVGAVTVPAGFAVIDKLVGPIAPGAMESFTVSLDTHAPGNRAGSITIANNDSNESPFNFAVSGAVAAPPSSGPAVTAALSGGTLTVNGTSTIDTIALALSSGGVSVVGNGKTIGGSPFHGVNRIVVNGNDGDDRIDAARVSIPVTINGGNGNDTLVGGSGADNLSGGNGNDALFGGPGIDVFHGDEGADTLTATDGLADALVDGGGGNDSIRKDRIDNATGT